MGLPKDLLIVVDSIDRKWASVYYNLLSFLNDFIGVGFPQWARNARNVSRYSSERDVAVQKEAIHSGYHVLLNAKELAEDLKRFLKESSKRAKESYHERILDISPENIMV